MTTAEPAPRTERDYLNEQHYIERADNGRARRELAEDRTPPPATRRRWAHTPTGGQLPRTRRAAKRQALAALQAWGYTDAQARQIIRDAEDVANLGLKAE